MAIQEIEVSKKGSDKTGFKREIHEGAYGLVLDTIQITQYTKPEESTVRELTANAVDSQREKEIAISILTGKSKPEDHYISRDGAKYDDSNFDRDYYSLEHLDTTKTKVKLVYEQNEGTGHCDNFRVIDYGVGLGASRLEGYFQIGYSTKRNSRGTLGAFGFGNKVALSTRCEYYTVISVHNGKKFSFNCYSYKIDSIIGKFNTETKTKNESITFSDGTEVYYEATNEKNYTEIIVPTKRHHRSKYEAAVKNQLLYFDNVEFIIQDEYDKSERKIDITADIKYNSKRLIISDNGRFSKPHVVIVKGDDDGKGTGVCYGYIDFTELEMQQLYGNVGVKCPIRSVIRDDETGVETVLQEGVEVTPSRESVVWSEHTRKFIQKIFNEAVEEATEIVQDQLKETDFLKWIVACRDVMHRSSRSSVLGELKQVVDTSSISPKFNGTKLKFGYPSTMFKGGRVRLNQTSFDRKTRKNTMSRTEIVAWDNLNEDRVYYKESRSSAKTDAYIESIAGPFITIEKISDEDLHKAFRDQESSGKMFMDQTKFDKMLADRDEMFKALLTSKVIKKYEDIVVPDSFGQEFEEQEEVQKAASMSAAERRKLEAKIVIHFLCPKANISYGHDKAFVWKQEDTKIIDVQDDEAQIVYGFSEDDEKLHFTAMLLRHQYPDDYTNDSYGYDDRNNKAYFNDKFKLIKINKANERYIKGRENIIHVSNFFQKIESDNG